MDVWRKWVVRGAILAMVWPVCLLVRPVSAGRLQGNAGRAGWVRLAGLPRRVLWTWERPEDLRAIHPETTGIAYLDQSIRIGYGAGGDDGLSVTAVHRRTPLAYPDGTSLLAVVRIEMRPGARLAGAELHSTVARTVERIGTSAGEPGIQALQVDFDATRSQREFYVLVLRGLRARMPAGLPLTMTALASWCSYDDWIGGLPVDEAVPMMFRMEPDRHAGEHKPELRIREPLCQNSVGVSTREAWPEAIDGKRMYIFPDRGWKSDLELLAERSER